MQPPLIETEMVTLFANTFKAPYYEHFYDVVRIADRIEQGIKAGRIIEPLETKGFIGRKMKGLVNNFEGGSNDKITDSYNPQIPTSHVAHINFNKPFSLNRANDQSNTQNTHQRPNTRYISEQLPPLPMPLKDIYVKLLSIG